MINRNSSTDSVIGIGGRNLHSNGIRNAPVAGVSSHRRVMSFSSTTSTTEEFNNNSNNVHLFSRNRRSLSVASSDESDLQVRLGRLTDGSTKPAKNELDNLLSSNEGEKHDYDWLLTPPGTPLSSSDGKESQPTSVAGRRNSSVRSGSATKNSRLSVTQSENSHPSRPARSTSATRSAISNAQYTNRNPNILNTSSASVSSYIRPSTPSNRSSSAARPSTTTSRASTPSRSRPSTTTTSGDRTTRPSQNSRPSTPTSPAIRSDSRPSTPTRRSPTPSATSSPSSGRILSSNGRNAGPTSRPSSPSPRVRPPQPIIPPDFPHETPPNLRTTLPERPLSAGRSRPGAAMTTSGSTARRQSSPIVTKGRIVDPPSRGRPNANGHVIETSESRRTLPIKSDNGAGFGRNISKKSLDMAIKHMDIRNGGIRPLSGSALFPQSIRSGNPRMIPARGSSGPGSNNGSLNNGSPYDAILLKEDLKNTSWLHCAEGKSDEGPLFGNGFEPLPEPFAPL